MRTEYGDEYILALTMWREASGEGTVGMQAVGHVIYNRAVKANTSVTRQCLEHNQFSSMTVRGDASTVRWYTSTDMPWIMAQSISRSLMNNDLPDITKGAQYYYNPKTATSPWFTANIVGKPDLHPKLVTLGAHEFFA